VLLFKSGVKTDETWGMRTIKGAVFQPESLLQEKEIIIGDLDLWELQKPIFLGVACVATC
jgi:hypothetical protein